MSERLVNLFRQLIQNEVLRQRFENILINVAATPIGSTTIMTTDAQLPEITIEETETAYTVSVQAGRFGGIEWVNSAVYIDKLDIKQEFVLIGKDTVSLIPIENANNIKGIILAYIYVPPNPEGYMFGLDKESSSLQVLRGFGAWSMLALRQYPEWLPINNVDAGTITGELTLDDGLTVTNSDGSVRLTSTGLEIYGIWDKTITTDTPEPKLLAQLVGGGLYFYNADGDVLSSYRADGALIAGWVIEPLRLYSGNIELSALGEIKTLDYLESVQGWKIAGDGSAEFNDIVARGHIEASSGQIGGWDISLSQLSSGNIIIDSVGEIRSADYEQDTSGWKISGDGTAEFNDVIVRGEVNATSGSIGGWNISTSQLTSGNIIIDSIGEIRSTNYISESSGWRIAGDGSVEFNNVIARGYIEADSGSIGGWNIGASQLTGGNIIIDSTGEIKSANYTSGVSGWKIDGTGTAEFNDVTVRGQVEATTGSIGGWEITSTSLRSGTDIVLDAANKQIKINNGQVLLGQDVVSDAAGLKIDDYNYFYYAKTSSTGMFRAGSTSNYILFDGSDVTVKGNITADGGSIAGWTITSSELKSPNNGLFLKSVDNRLEIQSAGTIKLAVGYLGGVGGHDASEFGIWVGAPNALYIEAPPDEEVIQQISGDWIVQNDADIILKNGSGQEILRIGTEGADLGLFIKDGASGDLFVKYTHQDVEFYDISTGTPTVQINSDGSGFLAQGKISWDTEGNLTIDAEIEATVAELGGWDITDTAIQKVNPDGTGIIISSVGYIESADYMYGTHGWRLAEDGTAEFRDVWVRGHIEADTGYIGDWDISDGKLVSGAMTLDADTKQITVEGASRTVKFGYNVASGQHGLYIDASNYFVWDDNVSQGKFRVGTGAQYLQFDGTNLEVSGNITAKSGTIGGWLISDNTISAGGITLDAINGTIYANDFQFKEGSVVIGNPNNSYLVWDGVNLHVFGNLVVSAGDNVVRFVDSDIELYDLRGALALGGELTEEYYGIVYKHKDSSVNLSRESIRFMHWRYDGQSYSGGPIDHRSMYWLLENEYRDVDGSLLDGGYIWGEVARPMPGYDQSRHIHWEFYVKSNGADKGWRYTQVRPAYITEHWENTYDGNMVKGELRFSSIQNYPYEEAHSSYPAKGIFVFKYSPISVLLSDPVLEYPEGTMFVYKSYLYYKDAYGTWRKVTGETVSAF